MEPDARKTAAMFKAFCDENRIRILQLLCTGEKCACRLLEALEVSQPTLSHHMKILCDSGVVVGRREGKWMHYSISPQGAQSAVEAIQALTEVQDDGTPDCCCDTEQDAGEEPAGGA